MSLKKRILLTGVVVVAVLMGFSTSAFAQNRPAKVSFESVSSTDNKIIIRWTKSYYADRYRVAYKAVGSDKWSYKNTTKTSIRISAKSLTDYKVKVRAIGGKCNGNWSAVKRVKTGIAIPKVTVTSYNDPVVYKWWKINKVKKYQIAYKLLNKSKWHYEYVAGDSYKLKCKPNKIYVLKVRAVKNGQKSKWSRPVNGGINYGLETPGYITKKAILQNLVKKYSEKEGCKVIDDDLGKYDIFKNDKSGVIEDCHAVRMSDNSIIGYVEYTHLQRSKTVDYREITYGKGCDYLDQTVKELSDEMNMDGFTYHYISGGFFMISARIDMLKQCFNESIEW